MSPRRTLAIAMASAALTLGAGGPAAAVLVPDPGPDVTPRPSPPAASSTAGPVVTETPRPLSTIVDSADVMTHLEAWQSIADAHEGTRAAGTAGHEASARYVEERLAAAGYETSRHTFPFTYEETRSSTLTVTDGRTTRALRHLPMAQSPGTEAGGMTRRLATPSGAPTGCSSADWAGVPASDTIALLTRGGCRFAEKARVAAGAGAVAVIVENTVSGPLNGVLGGRPEDHLPSVGVTAEVGRELRGLPAETTVSIELDKVVEERQTFSVIAQAPARSTDRVAMFGAHLDSGAEGPGINDNGTGSAILLETALRLAEQGPTDTAVRFAWWGASDLGNLGSRAYVSDLAEGPEGLDGIALYVDVDTVASPNHIIGVHDGDEAAASTLTDHLDSVGQAWVATTPPEDSDLRTFTDRGVPATGLSTGTSGTKSTGESAVFGGRAGLPYDPNNGTVADDLDNVDAAVLETTTEVVAHTVETLAFR